PPSLKRRVRSDLGHLSNAQAAQLVAQVLHRGLRHLVLAHLSEHNNTPAHARREAKAVLELHESRAALHLAGQARPLPPIELDAARAMGDAGLVPRDAVEECAKKAGSFTADDAARIDEIEKTTKHDVIAFLTFLEERIGPAARHLHFGMTSSDVLDTSLAI